MLLYDLLIKTDPKKLVYVYDSHSHEPIFYDFLDELLFVDALEGKEWEVKCWKRYRNGDELRIYVTPIKKEQEEAMRNE